LPLPAAGFEKPSAIQQKGIVPFTKNLDVIQQAQSGTGKTATFCAGILNNLDYNLLECQALVLAPTRELAQQIEKVMRSLGDYLHVSIAGLFWHEEHGVLYSTCFHVGRPLLGYIHDMAGDLM
jgi:translation initiation factor 4A